MSLFSFQIITPEAVVFETDCKEVDLPGSEGRFGVLSGHMNFVSSLVPGIVTIQLESGKNITFTISDGFADVTPESCTVLVEMACAKDKVDIEKAKTRISELTSLIQAQTGDHEKIELTNELKFWESTL